jgi:hypothetical protein
LDCSPCNICIDTKCSSGFHLVAVFSVSISNKVSILSHYTFGMEGA